MNGSETIMVGWREWVSLPALQLPAIKAKVDTGAKTSCLHAFEIGAYQEKGIDMVRFLMHPIQRNQDFFVECHAPIHDYREVSDSGGHREMRYVIETTMLLGQSQWNIELTLTNRDTMMFRMLLGRQGMMERVHVDPAASYLTGKLYPKKLYQLPADQ